METIRIMKTREYNMVVETSQAWRVGELLTDRELVKIKRVREAPKTKRVRVYANSVRYSGSKRFGDTTMRA